MNINNYICTRLYKQLNTSRNQAIFLIYTREYSVFYTCTTRVLQMCIMYYIHIAALDTHLLKIYSDFVINSFFGNLFLLSFTINSYKYIWMIIVYV